LQDKLDAFIDLAPGLPPTPRIMVKLLDMFKQPNQDIDEIVQLLTPDPSFTMELLKCCNSAYFSGDKPAEDVFEAVSRLGLQEVYRIALALFAKSAILRPGGDGGASVQILWRHSLAVAVAAGVLADETGESHAAAFTAGLLHDVGKVVLVSVDKKKYTQAVLDAGMFRRPVPVTEKALFGFDHAEVGARLLVCWNLPPNIVAAVLCHHQPLAAQPYERLAAIVQVANLIAHGTGEKLAGEIKGMQHASESLALLKLAPDAIPRLMPAMQASLEKTRALVAA
jgi:putative nucleotidyltransferase with HDIG domain